MSRGKSEYIEKDLLKKLYSLDLSGAELRIFICILDDKDDYNSSYVEIAQKLNMSIETVKKSIKGLKDKNIISQELIGHTGQKSIWNIVGSKMTLPIEKPTQNVSQEVGSKKTRVKKDPTVGSNLTQKQGQKRPSYQKDQKGPNTLSSSKKENASFESVSNSNTNRKEFQSYWVSMVKGETGYVPSSSDYKKNGKALSEISEKYSLEEFKLLFEAFKLHNQFESFKIDILNCNSYLNSGFLGRITNYKERAKEALIAEHFYSIPEEKKVIEFIPFSPSEKAKSKEMFNDIINEMRMEGTI